MCWFRANVRFGSWCALFALTIQLALSFGHLHRHGIVWRSGTSPLSVLWSSRPPAAVPDAPAVPADPTGIAFEHCAICAIINLAGSIVPAAPPALPLPTVIKRIRLGESVDLVLAA